MLWAFRAGAGVLLLATNVLDSRERPEGRITKGRVVGAPETVLHEG
jgi:hypothetical protein